MFDLDWKVDLHFRFEHSYRERFRSGIFLPIVVVL